MALQVLSIALVSSSALLGGGGSLSDILTCSQGPAISRGRPFCCEPAREARARGAKRAAIKRAFKWVLGKSVPSGADTEIVDASIPEEGDSPPAATSAAADTELEDTAILVQEDDSLTAAPSTIAAIVVPSNPPAVAPPASVPVPVPAPPPAPTPAPALAPAPVATAPAPVPGDAVQKEMSVAAPLSDVFAAVTDFPNYPKWVSGLKGVEILEADAETGLGTVVEFKAGTMGLAISYTLEYTITPEQINWKSIAGGVKSIIGQYRLSAIDDTHTLVQYQLEVDAGFGVPGPVRRAVTKLVVGAALPELKRFVEK